MQSSEPVLYSRESEYAEDESEFDWLGNITSFSLENTVDTNAVYKSDHSTMSATDQLKDRDSPAITVDYVPDSLDVFEDFLGGESETDTVLTSQFIGQTKDEYVRVVGCLPESLTLTISRDSVMNIQAGYIPTEIREWDTLPHGQTTARDPNRDPLSVKDFQVMLVGARTVDHAIRELRLTMDIMYEIFIDRDSDLHTKISQVVPISRETRLDMTIVSDDMEFFEIVRDFGKHEVILKLDEYDIQMTGVEFENSPFEARPDGMFTQSIRTTSARRTSLSDDILFVPKDTTHTVEADTTEEYHKAVVEGQLDVEGELDLTQ